MAAAASIALVVGAQERSTPQERPNKPAETKLIGINILDPGMKLLDTFGSPDEIQPLTIGGGGVGPGGGFGGGGGGVPGGPTAAGAAGPGGSTASANFLGDPFNEQFNQRRVGVGPEGGQGPTAAGAGGGGGGVGGGAQTDASRILYTRWVYKRGASRYAFVVDKFNRVVQIEAVGITDAKVTTSRGIKFGATFANVIRAYNVPDAYEIGGDSIVIRYLVRDHVAFKLSRLKAKDPHRVTGIVVAAGKE
jgi:hypothetical protein